VIVFQKQYPSIAKWMKYGWIEVGDASDWGKGSFIRALNIGGIVFEGEDDYESLDHALEDLERGIAAWLEVNEEKPSP
jgi:hypothetical protein